MDQVEATGRAGARTAVPLGVAVALFGVAFGVLALEAGLTPAAAVAMSATTFAGSAQLASVAVVDAGGGLAAAISAAALLNSRYLPMGVSVAPVAWGGPVARLLGAQLMIDESWALAHTRDGLAWSRLLGAGALLYLAWVLGTAMGVLAGQALADPAALGLDAAFPALFLGLLWPWLRHRRTAAVATLAGGLALALTPVLPTGLPLLAAGGVALLGLLGARR